MSKGLPINNLPYRTRAYINNQVLIPANLVRALGIERARYADIVISFNGLVIELRNVLLLRTKHTSSRQFTIPREIRELYGIRPMDQIEVIQIRPRYVKEFETELTRPV
ncbi:AbrB/MazE/SpoVT family DNA-binding domain-containing protein [Vulcanisaeta distributa]|uniref:SpoVT-AbrB domain-containing protein n=1 Tax=Vulcanisaeta distributa (strain DSM 14429 / JCM 11212 / NBRC 100878 / IC-017) TaxID=572478 RepID=E1QQH8_VULDI|nr:AbrB/MazE/SpoVT family DNA-binding domain-containing protein [Vulcanisaeta distributa]ADN50473.1 conserved hypothetical protein [Vulcanisaeta distributa DSM 14429]